MSELKYLNAVHLCRHLIPPTYKYKMCMETQMIQEQAQIHTWNKPANIFKLKYKTTTKMSELKYLNAVHLCRHLIPPTYKYKMCMETQMIQEQAQIHTWNKPANIFKLKYKTTTKMSELKYLNAVHLCRHLIPPTSHPLSLHLGFRFDWQEIWKHWPIQRKKLDRKKWIIPKKSSLPSPRF